MLLPGFGFLLIPLELLLVQTGREGLAGPTSLGAADVSPSITDMEPTCLPVGTHVKHRGEGGKMS